MVPGAAGHMGPALQGIFVGQGPRALPGVRYKPGRATARVAPTEVQQEVPWAGDRKGRPYESVTRGAVKRVVGGVRPYEFFAIQIFAIKKGCR